MSQKLQLHVSGLTMLSRCGEQFRRRYIEGERIAPAVAVIVGQGVHRSVERNMRARLEDPHKAALLPLDEIYDVARDAVDRQWKDGVTLDEDEAARGAENVRGEAVDKAVRLSEAHHFHIAPQIRPTHVERPWVLDLKGYDFQLAGTIDLQTEHFADFGSDSIRDTKTTAKTPSGNPAQGSIQLTCYALAVKVSDGEIPEGVGLDYLIDLKRGPKAETYWSTRNDQDFRPFLDRVAVAHAAMERGIFMPANPDDWWCSAKYCGYHATCRYPRRPVSSAPGLIQIAPVEGTVAR